MTDENKALIWGPLIEVAGRITASALMAAILYTSYRGDWVWSSQLKQVQQAADSYKMERDEWKMLALKATSLAEGDRPLIGAAAKERDTVSSIRARLQEVESR